MKGRSHRLASPVQPVEAGAAFAPCVGRALKVGLWPGVLVAEAVVVGDCAARDYYGAALASRAGRVQRARKLT